jgi:hypothetical protein
MGAVMIDKYLLDDLRLRSDEKGELARWVIQLQADVDTERRKSASLESVIYARDTRIAELERANTSQDDHIIQQQDRIESLEKTNAGLGRRLGDAEKRLATPIKIVNYDEFFICHVSGASDDYCKGWVDGRNAAARDVGKAGFTVEDK